MRHLIICLSLLILFGCAKKDDGPSSVLGKPLFSSWTGPSGQPLNLSGGQMNTPIAFGFVTTTGLRCICNMVFAGSGSSGTFSLSSCTGDAGCGSFSETGTFDLSGITLNLCDPSCAAYH